MKRACLRGGGDAGYSLVALMASITIMMILMSAAMPSWRYIMKNDREEELLFRGGEIADAIVRFQKKNGNAFPTSLDQLVKGKFLRKPYKDPMTPDGKWRLVHQGETVAPVTNPGQPGGRPGASPTPSPTPTPRPAGPGVATGTTLGPIIGVASNSRDKSLRIFNGRTQYNEWVFAAGQPRIIGKPATIGTGGSAPGHRGTPGGVTPTPPPTPR